MVKWCLALLSLLFLSSASAVSLGPEFQVYPAGVIVAAQARWQVMDQHELGFRLGANFTDRQDFGENDDEQGEGLGLSIGYRYYFSAAKTLFVGGRTDLWELEIDWRNNDGTSGMTDILVLQPTSEVGYRWFWHEALSIVTSLALGYEINIRTEGEDVGQGAILLAGLSLNYYF